jgi:hypothetical protein
MRNIGHFPGLSALRAGSMVRLLARSFLSLELFIAQPQGDETCGFFPSGIPFFPELLPSCAPDNPAPHTGYAAGETEATCKQQVKYRRLANKSGGLELKRLAGASRLLKRFTKSLFARAIYD